MKEIEVITIRQIEEFDRMLLENPQMRRQVNKVVSRVMSRVRSRVSRSARDFIGDDPRQAYKAVKRAVYKRIIGGNVSILSRRKRSGYSASLPPTSRIRSQRTAKVMSYWGADRGFILRFLNAGTRQRAVSSINSERFGNVRRRSNRMYKSSMLGNRGRIEGHNWFESSATAAMDEGAELLAKFIEEEIKKVNKEYGDINS